MAASTAATHLDISEFGRFAVAYRQNLVVTFTQDPVIVLGMTLAITLKQQTFMKS
ncbi:hypothetical protein [Arenicella chitinivorans]|uniref:hypothetical protein n=1 Tax=Arenicella chitinivorans TaxID=1329800 RepID=UPI00167A20DE|nr:hypothetical protein [Arenicella chitinivorans]